ncbi:MAG TPA: porin family protein [Mucilaginibacter sp.]|nr:porin family protein [Mucilaginibacter sp.]
MKKILLILPLVLINAALFAQSLTYGAIGGIVIAHQHRFTPPFTTYLNSSSIITFSAGGFADINYGKFSIRPGLFLSGQGDELKVISETSSPPTTGKGDYTERMMFAQIPVDFIYHFKLPNVTIYLGGGPYMAVGLTGSVTGTSDYYLNSDPGKVNHQKFNDDVGFGGDSGNNLIQFGVNATAGIRFKTRMLLNVNYDWGLTNLYQPQVPNIARNRALCISLGYFLK